MSGTPGGFRAPAPALGQHNAPILGELGLTPADIDTLAATGIL
jgi:crotonobetainyl-CoA:carnitine CoA-transferase CaiB-like acyl-CoA transferase